MCLLAKSTPGRWGLALEVEDKLYAVKYLRYQSRPVQGLGHWGIRAWLPPKPQWIAPCDPSYGKVGRQCSHRPCLAGCRGHRPRKLAFFFFFLKSGRRFLKAVWLKIIKVTWQLLLSICEVRALSYSVFLAYLPFVNTWITKCFLCIPSTVCAVH